MFNIALQCQNKDIAVLAIISEIDCVLHTTLQRRFEVPCYALKNNRFQHCNNPSLGLGYLRLAQSHCLTSSVSRALAWMGAICPLEAHRGQGDFEREANILYATRGFLYVAGIRTQRFHESFPLNGEEG